MLELDLISLFSIFLFFPLLSFKDHGRASFSKYSFQSLITPYLLIHKCIYIFTISSGLSVRFTFIRLYPYLLCALCFLIIYAKTTRTVDCFINVSHELFERLITSIPWLLGKYKLYEGIYLFYQIFYKN